MTVPIFGVIKFFRADRGFGFIRRDDAGGDVFVHASDLKRGGIDPNNVEDGRTRIGLDVERDHKGDKAINVTISTQLAPNNNGF
jgi:CspA family cold shock protein